MNDSIFNTKKDFAIVIRNAIPKEVCKFISIEMRLMSSCVNWFNNNNENPGGKEIGLTESFSVYSPLFFEALSLTVQPVVERAVNKKLYPTYSYGRIYRNNAKLERHLDRRSSEYTVSCCLDKDKDAPEWELVVRHQDRSKTRVILNVGDILIYPGRDLVHWREGAFQGNEQIQAFVQYVDVAGDSKDLKWDTRPLMGLPFETSKDYVKEELDRMLELINIIKSDDELPTIADVLPYEFIDNVTDVSASAQSESAERKDD